MKALPLAMAAALAATGLASHEARAGACPKPPDPQRVILFVNVNNAFNEVVSAQDAACQLGETLDVLPPITGDPKQLSAAKTSLTSLQDHFIALCGDSNGNVKNTPECNTQAAAIAKKSDAYDLLVKQIPPVHDADVAREIQNLSSKNAAIQTVIISGHDGGTIVSSSPGDQYKGNDFADDYNRSHVTEGALFGALNKYYGDKPALSNQLQSMLLWGCYTAVPEAVQNIKTDVPSLRLIAGFDGSAPSSVRSWDQDLLKDTLLKSETAIDSANENDLKDTLAGLSGLNQTTAGIYVDTCNSDNFYFHRVSGGSTAKSWSLESMSQASVCKIALAPEEKQFESYLDGTIDTPANTDTGPLRSLYTFARVNSGCIPAADPLNPDAIGGVLFFSGVKQNFAVAAAQRIQAANAEIQNLPASSPIRQAYWEPTLQNMQKKSRKQILELANLLNDPSLANDPDVKKLAGDMENYLVHVSPSCMDMIEWHSYNPGVVPKAGCPL